MKIEKIDEKTWRIPGEANLEQIYQAAPQMELFVEPLSAKVAIGKFIAESGMGYGSLNWGTLGRTLNQLKGSVRRKHSQKSGKEQSVPFNFGSVHMGYTNTGYALQRISEGAEKFFAEGLQAHYEHSNTVLEMGPVEEVVVRLRPQKNVKAYWQDKPFDDMPYIPEVKDIFFVNDTLAPQLGLEKGGWVITTRDDLKAIEGKACEDLWSKRFIEDRLPSEQTALVKVLTTKSGARKIYAYVQEQSAPFFALYTLKGLLVLSAIAPAAQSGLESILQELKFTYRIR